MLKSAPLLPVVITQGDSAGIGPEIIAKAFRDAPAELAGCPGPAIRCAARRNVSTSPATKQPAIPVAQIALPAQATLVPARCIPVLPVAGIPGPQPWGRVNADAGRAAAESVLWAVRAALQGQVAAIVTAPVHKEALSAAGVGFPGHTELLQWEAAAYQQVPLDQMPVRMMLANDELRTVLVSIHVSLRDAIDAVTYENVLQTLVIAHHTLSRSLGRPPRIAVAGLNPHAGEGGLFGREEIETIAPAIAAARAQGIDAAGPFAPDTVFMRARMTPQHSGEFDVVIAMYHDQGLIPVKYLGVDKGVNVTLGLPLVRTSPDHGTAFDIAGQGIADPASFVEAVRMARQLTA